MRPFRSRRNGVDCVPAAGEAVNVMADKQRVDGGLRELALFAGAGGGILGGKLLGWRTVCAVERDAYAAQVLAQRQNDGILETFPIWSDVSSFDGKPWRGIVDVVSGGFPCQDISAAGKGAGITGERSGLWKEFARIIGEVRPRYAFIENSPMLTIRGLETVLCDLAAMGFDAEWGIVSAADVGAPHRRERLWIVADAMCKRPAAGTKDETRGTLHNQHGDSSAQECGRDNIESRACSCAEYVADAVEPRCEAQRLCAEWARNGGQTKLCRCETAHPGQQQRDGRRDGSSWWSREPQETLRDAGRRGGKEDGLSDLESQLGRTLDGMAAPLDAINAD